VMAVLFFPAWGVSQSNRIADADTLRVKGEAYQEKGQFKEAEYYYREALDLYRQLQDTTARLRTELYYAEVLAYRAKYEESVALLNKLMKVDHPSADHSFRARIHSDLGWVSRRKGDNEAARDYYREGLQLAKEAGDSTLIAYLYNNLGRVSSDGESLEYYKKAVPYFEALENRRGLATVLNNMASIYKDLLLYDKALTYYTRSLNMDKELGNSNMMGIDYQNIGDLQEELGNYRRALLAYQQSLTHKKRAGDPASISNILNNIGVLYATLGNSERALSYFRQSLELEEEFAAPKDLAVSYKNIGTRLWDLGSHEEAERYYRQALLKKREAGDRQALVSSLLDLAKVEKAGRNYAKAERYAREALAIADSAGNYGNLRSVYNWLGHIYLDRDRLKESLGYYKKAYSYSRFMSSKEQIYPLINIARTFNNLGSDSSLVYGRRAFNLIENQRKKAGAVSELRSGFFKQFTDFYTELASWTLAYENNREEAYKLVEAVKARTFSEELEKAAKRIDEKFPEEVRIERNKLLTSIDRLYSRLEHAEDDKEKKVLNRQISNIELEYQAFESRLYDEYPEFKQLETPDPVSLSRAQAVCERNTAILEYAVTSKQLIAFLIHQNGVAVHRAELPATADSARSHSKLTTQVQDFKDAILSHADRQELEFHSEKLYKLLLEPFGEKLSSFSNLIIVPDGPLAYLPFEALRKDNRYLIEQFNIKYEPSVTSYTLLKEADRDQPKQLLAVAGSGPSDNTLWAGIQRNNYSALPSTIIEIDSVSSHFTNSSIIKQENITEQKLKSMLNSPVRFIHLATHGVIDEDNPDQSGLVFSTSREVNASSKEDGLLKSTEIYRLNLNSDMVVLSACNTGLGKIVKGEGMLGLQRSFFYAGASTVVVSLWSVYDRSTAYLMKEFYRAIVSEEEYSSSWISDFLRWVGWDQSIPFGEKAAAMRKAKLKLINHPMFNHPIYWAPFIVVGR